MGRLSIGPERASYDLDESYRTCSECGGDCVPEPSGADGLGVRVMWVCPQHGVHSAVDPFAHLREQDRRDREREQGQ